MARRRHRRVSIFNSHERVNAAFFCFPGQAGVFVRGLVKHFIRAICPGGLAAHRRDARFNFQVPGVHVRSDCEGFRLITVCGAHLCWWALVWDGSCQLLAATVNLCLFVFALGGDPWHHPRAGVNEDTSGGCV